MVHLTTAERNCSPKPLSHRIMAPNQGLVVNLTRSFPAGPTPQVIRINPLTDLDRPLVKIRDTVLPWALDIFILTIYRDH